MTNAKQQMPVIKNLIWILAITVFVVSRGHILSFFKTKIVNRQTQRLSRFAPFLFSSPRSRPYPPAFKPCRLEAEPEAEG